MPTRPEPIVIEWFGTTPSKKNAYKKGGPGRGMYKDRKLQSQIDALFLQIPAELRNLQLEHPDILFEMHVDDSNKHCLLRDRDNAYTCAQDVLVDAGVLRDDSMKYFNGTITIPPAVFTREGCDRVVITLYPR